MIFARALTLLLEKVEKTKLAALAKPRPRRSIRSETDKVHKSTPPSRHIPREVKRAVWQRDGGQCAFVAASGRRCRERTFLEFHHLKAYAKQGPATIANISLCCRRHNQYEAELIFGPHGASFVREGFEPFVPRPLPAVGVGRDAARAPSPELPRSGVDSTGGLEDGAPRHGPLRL